MKFKSIYLIDDDPVTNFIHKKLIKLHFPEIAVKEWIEAENALHSITTQSDLDSLPDLILLDLNMPVMNGWQFLDKLTELYPSMIKKPIVYIVSSSGFHEDMERSSKYVFVRGFYTKPMNLDKLKELFA
jgi:CheY-like chemotaxis protein